MLTCANDGGRVIIAHRACRVHGYLNPMQRSRCGVCSLCLPKNETTHLGSLLCPKPKSASLRGTKEKEVKSVVQVGGPGGKVY
jgi:hypothetical protein